MSVGAAIGESFATIISAAPVLVEREGSEWRRIEVAGARQHACQINAAVGTHGNSPQGIFTSENKAAKRDRIADDRLMPDGVAGGVQLEHVRIVRQTPTLAC